MTPTTLGGMTSKGTPRRTIRINDELWDAASQKAETAGRNRVRRHPARTRGLHARTYGGRMSTDPTTTLLTITSLIDQLVTIRSRHGDLPVLIAGYEEGLDEPAPIEVVSVFDRGEAEKHARWWNGRFSFDRDRYDEDTAPAFDAVVIPR